MGRLYLIEYDQTPDKRFYLCRSCQTHIASAQDFLSSFAFYFEDSCEHLLRKSVEVEEPTLEIREGTIRMEQKKLLFWNGKVLVDELPIPQSEAFV